MTGGVVALLFQSADVFPYGNTNVVGGNGLVHFFSFSVCIVLCRVMLLCCVVLLCHVVLLCCVVLCCGCVVQVIVELCERGEYNQTSFCCTCLVSGLCTPNIFSLPPSTHFLCASLPHPPLLPIILANPLTFLSSLPPSFPLNLPSITSYRPSLTSYHPSLTSYHPSLTSYHPSLTSYHPSLPFIILDPLLLIQLSLISSPFHLISIFFISPSLPLIFYLPSR